MLLLCHAKTMQVAALGLGLAVLSSAPASAGFADFVQTMAKISADRPHFLNNLQVVLREVLRQRTRRRAEALTLSFAAAEADLP